MRHTEQLRDARRNEIDKVTGLADRIGGVAAKKRKWRLQHARMPQGDERGHAIFV